MLDDTKQTAVSARFFRLVAIVSVFAGFFASSAFAAGTATVRVTNAGTVPLSVSGADVRPGTSATRTVPAERAGRLPVSAPDGWTVDGSSSYPALRPGASFSVRLSAVRDGLVPAPVSATRAAPDPVPAVRAAPAPSLPPAVLAPAVPAARPRTRTVPAARAAGAAGERTSEIPMLWVRDGEVRTGGLSRNPFSYRRDGSGRLLRISTSEDTPGGSGASARASLWLAAATAAMFRNDPMDGVKMEVEYTGRVDGGSAGGVTCLAILCALDGIPFPDDFAMTGAILPDGTIGLVGGVALKLEGAAEAGARRVCIPAFLRFEEQEDGDFVDLWGKAEELGLELHPVSSVEEAYAVLRGRAPDPRPVVPDATVYRDTPGVDAALLERVKPLVEEAVRREEGHEEGDMPGGDAKRSFDVLEPFANGSVDFDVAFEAGMLHVLAEQVADRLAWWRTVGKLSERIGELEGRYDDGTPSGLSAWERDLEGRFDQVGETIGRAEAAWTLRGAIGLGASALAGQCVEVNFFSQCRTVFRRASRDAEERGGAGRPSRGDRVEGLLRREALCLLFEERFRILDESAQSIAAALPARDAGPHADRAEEFFHAAQTALRNSLTALHGNGVIGLLELKNYDWELYLQKCEEADGYHNAAVRLRDEDPSIAGFLAVVSAMAQADALAQGCMAATLAGSEIGASIDEDGDLVWKKHPFLSFLLRTARDRAVATLAECDRAGVPCPRVRAHIQNADYHRDDDSFDRFDVVREYWCATLKAKALLMMFAPSSAPARR